MDIDDRVFQLSQTEAGMLGLAFHPNFPTNNRVYVNYSSRRRRHTFDQRRNSRAPTEA